MLKILLKNTYIIVGIVMFVFLLVGFLWLQVSLGESLLYALILATVGTVAEWWRKHVW